MRRLFRIGALCVVAFGALQASAMPLGYRLSRQARAAVRQAEEMPTPEPTQEVWTVTFDAQGGAAAEATRSVTNGCAVGELPAATLDGYTLSDWFTAAEGGEVVTAETIVTADVTYYAHWTLNVEPEPTPEPTPTPTPTPEPTLEPVPEPVVAPELYDVTEIAGAAPVAAASEYNGYLYDEKSGAVKGTIQVKVGKPGKKDGKASIKAMVVVGTKKVSLKAVDKGKAVINPDGSTEIELVGMGAEECVVALGAVGLSGYYGAYTIDGARNFFSSKDKGEQNAANGILEKWIGAVNVAWREEGAARSAIAPYQTLSVTIGKKGKAKVAVTLADGTKATANAQMLIGEEWLCVPVVVTKKMNLAFTLWLPRNGGAALVEGLSGDVVVGKPGALAANAAFRVGKSAALWQQIPGTVLVDYLPDGMAVTQSGAKWTLPKAGKVQKAKDGTIDSSKLGENPSALKLTYKAKDGSFKGSFKVYADNGGKLKATTVNVAGIVVGGVGYGTATIKKVGSVPISIE